MHAIIMSSGMVKELKGEVEAVFINNEKSSAAIGPEGQRQSPSAVAQ